MAARPRDQAQAVPVDRPTVQPWRRPGLQASKRQTEAGECESKPDGGCLTDPAGRRLLATDMDHPAQEGAGRQHRGGAADPLTTGTNNSLERPSFPISTSSTAAARMVRPAVASSSARIARR